MDFVTRCSKKEHTTPVKIEAPEKSNLAPTLEYSVLNITCGVQALIYDNIKHQGYHLPPEILDIVPMLAFDEGYDNVCGSNLSSCIR